MSKDLHGPIMILALTAMVGIMSWLYVQWLEAEARYTDARLDALKEEQVRMGALVTDQLIKTLDVDATQAASIEGMIRRVDRINARFDKHIEHK